MNPRTILLRNRSKDLNKASLDQIHALFEEHWEEIAGSPACYTGEKVQSRINQVFIQVAICFAEKFSERYTHYYKMLMPSARNLDKQFLSTLEAVLETPLNDMFVAKDLSLLSVADTVEYARNKRHLANVEMKIASLVLEEKEQLLRHKEARAITTELMFPRKIILPLNVVNIRTATAEALRTLGISCLHGRDASGKAIGEFYHHLKTLSAEEIASLEGYKKFKERFHDLREGVACVFWCGQQFCTIAFNFIRDEARWTDSHIQDYFSRTDRIYYTEITPLQICIDTVVAQVNADVNPDALLDEENAKNQLALIKQYIETTNWDLRNIKHTSIEIPEKKQLPVTVKTAYMILLKGLNHRDAQPVKILLEVKELFCRSYFSEANSKNVQVLAFYRSFYTNKHMIYMIEQLSHPQQLDEHKQVGMMEILPKR